MLQGSRRAVLRAAAAARAGAAATPTSRSLASIALATSPASALSRSQHVAPVALAAAAHAKQTLPSALRRAFSSAANGETINVPVPSMGDSISEGTVVEWLKQPGDAVEMDEVVVVLETDKVSVDVRAPAAGKLAKHLAAIDDNVLVGAPLFQLEQGESDSTSESESASAPASKADDDKSKSASDDKSASSASTSSAPQGEPETVNVPSMGDSISEGTIVHWAKSVGDAVEMDDVVVVIETDKVSVDVRAPKAGVLHDVLANVDDVVTIGAPLFQLRAGASSASDKKKKEKETSASKKKKTKDDNDAAATTKETKADKTTATKAPAQEDKKRSSAHDNDTTHPLLVSPTRASRREKMSRMRLRTAERLKESQNTSASLTTFQEVDMTQLLALRTQYKDAFEAKHHVKLGFMSAFIKASASALLEVPGVNAMIDDAHQEIVYRDYVDMSVAVSTPKGLVTPVLRNTESLSFAGIEAELAALAERARAGKLTLEEMTGGNFTISNGGVFGSLMGTPIINLPQSAILGMHATKLRPVVRDGAVVARPMMYLALTYDHRLIDGREAVTCLKSIADKIEHPERLLLDL